MVDAGPELELQTLCDSRCGLNGVAVISSSNVSAVGSYLDGGHFRTLTLRWNGSRWSRVSSANPAPGDNELFSVAALPTAEAWAVGAKGDAPERTLVEKWSGTAWQAVTSPNASGWNNILHGVTLPARGSGWAVGSAFDGTWTRTLILRGC